MELLRKKDKTRESQSHVAPRNLMNFATVFCLLTNSFNAYHINDYNILYAMLQAGVITVIKAEKDPTLRQLKFW